MFQLIQTSLPKLKLFLNHIKLFISQQPSIFSKKKKKKSQHYHISRIITYIFHTIKSTKHYKINQIDRFSYLDLSFLPTNFQES